MPQRQARNGHRCLVERNARGAADVTERRLFRPLAGDLREAEQEVEEPVRRAHIGLHRPNSLHDPRRIGSGRRHEPPLHEVEFQRGGRERVGQGMPESKQDGSGSAARVGRGRSVHVDEQRKLAHSPGGRASFYGRLRIIPG